MRFRSYNNEFKISAATILSCFNNIVIDRRNANGIVQKTIKIPCVYGNRSRIIKSLENKNKTLKPPCLAISKNNISRDNSRIHDLNSHLLNQVGNSIDLNLISPVPIDIEYTMDIVTKYQEDLDQIISNYIPFTNPDFYVIWHHPKYPTLDIKSQIVWSARIDIKTPTELGDKESENSYASTTFTYKTWIFPGLYQDDGNRPRIERINFCSNLVEVGEEGYATNQWYNVPYNQSFEQFQDSIIQGYITPENSDWLRISGGLSGYFSDISGMCTGELIGQDISGNPIFLSNGDNNGLLLINEEKYLSKGMQNFDYWNYYLETLSGKLSGGVL